MATPKKAKKSAEPKEEVTEVIAPDPVVEVVATPEAKHPCAKCGSKVAAYETVGTDGKGYCSMDCFKGR